MDFHGLECGPVLERQDGKMKVEKLNNGVKRQA